MENLERNQTTREILVPMQGSDIELVNKTMKLLQLNKEAEEVKQKRRTLNYVMKKIDGARSKLTEEMDDQSTYQTIDCEEIKNFGSDALPLDELGIAVPPRHLVVVRLDTSEIIESRPLTYAEAQMELLPEDEEKEAGTEETDPTDDPEESDENE